MICHIFIFFSFCSALNGKNKKNHHARGKSHMDLILVIWIFLSSPLLFQIIFVMVYFLHVEKPLLQTVTFLSNHFLFHRLRVRVFTWMCSVIKRELSLAIQPQYLECLQMATPILTALLHNVDCSNVRLSLGENNVKPSGLSYLLFLIILNLYSTHRVSYSSKKIKSKTHTHTHTHTNLIDSYF